MDISKLLKIISWNPILAGLALCNVSITKAIDDWDEYNLWEMIIDGDYNRVVAVLSAGVLILIIGITIRNNAAWAIYAYAAVNMIICIALVLLGFYQVYTLVVDKYLDAEFTIYFSVYLLAFSYSIVMLLVVLHIIRNVSINSK